MFNKNILNLREFMDNLGIHKAEMAKILNTDEKELQKMLDFRTKVSLRQVLELMDTYGEEEVAACLIDEAEKEAILNPYGPMAHLVTESVTNEKEELVAEARELKEKEHPKHGGSWREKYYAVTEELDQLRGENVHLRELLKKYKEEFRSLDKLE